jgi:integrase
MMGVDARAEAVKGNPVRELETRASSGAHGAIAIPIGDPPTILDRVRADSRLIETDLVDLIVFVAGTGVRIGEGCSIAWPDVDLDAGAVMIRKSKTNAGKRRIRVSSTVIGMLMARRVKGGPNDDGLVFPTILGRPRDPRDAAREWADARVRLELPERYTFHAFARRWRRCSTRRASQRGTSRSISGTRTRR